ncbi:YchJ family metal-binding protein [Naasia sp. SYSU D00057]|uniref:YchJ family protein n=1 Tax=Naasia sp. SYSU D00057 TaxID=2817380 RepID=UPI001B30E247|nr:YchJ family metal-binding protein [Naasia sp. SYSU D00057]
MSERASCPCGSRLPYDDCCRPFHDGASAPTAVQLMRSRFSAYALGLVEHVSRTWDPGTRPEPLDLDDGITWRRLQIVDTARGGQDDTEGVVEFRASYRTEEGAGLLHERSRFRRDGDRWLYVDGVVLQN